MSKILAALTAIFQLFMPQKELASVPVEILLGGDIMLGRSVLATTVEKKDFNYPFLKISDTLADADLTFVNLENAIIEDCPVLHSHTMVFCGLPGMLDGLKYAGVDIVTLANNHSYNYGKAGMEETEVHLKNANIAYVGLDNLVIREVNDTKFGFLGFELIDHGPTEKDLSLISDSDSQVDILIVGIHWGSEYKSEPNQNQREWAKKIIESGADVISGHHPHWVQSIDYIEGKPVYYSLGNLVFDQMWSEETKKGLLVKLTYLDKKIVSEDKINIYIEKVGQPKVE